MEDKEIKELLEKCDKDIKKSPITHKIMEAHNKILNDYSMMSFKALPQMFTNANDQFIKPAKELKRKLNTIERLEENWEDDVVTEDFVNNELNRLGYGDRKYSPKN